MRTSRGADGSLGPPGDRMLPWGLVEAIAAHHDASRSAMVTRSEDVVVAIEVQVRVVRLSASLQ
ncbi:MAG TPA: hypothetical protein VMJ65_00055 [Solirubrobacteraceae bacterium]|nr:hypothetical protein [Solirubrobacteraceae bacterium]